MGFSCIFTPKSRPDCQRLWGRHLYEKRVFTELAFQSNINKFRYEINGI
jgi:hypothetical protein